MQGSRKGENFLLCDSIVFCLLSVTLVISRHCQWGSFLASVYISMPCPGCWMEYFGEKHPDIYVLISFAAAFLIWQNLVERDIPRSVFRTCRVAVPLSWQEGQHPVSRPLIPRCSANRIFMRGEREGRRDGHQVDSSVHQPTFRRRRGQTKLSSSLNPYRCLGLHF